MKLITKIFLIFQLLDIIITYFAYDTGLVWAINPDTTLAWTKADLSTLEFGAKIKG